MDDGFWSWYFNRRWRMLFTLPVLLFFGLNTLWFLVLVITIEIDILLWNFLGFLFVGPTIGWIIPGIPVMISSLVWVLLPAIWDDWHASSFVKAPTWLALALASSTIPYFITSLGLNSLLARGVPLRATGWWFSIWGG